MDIAGTIQRLLIMMPIFWLSLSVHEAAHAITAYYCGDDTARDMGRITLNPLAHIDLLGTVIMPLLSVISGGYALLAWAKPVPVNPMNFRNMRRDDVLVSVAGPASNIVLSFCFLILLIVLIKSPLDPNESRIGEFMYQFVQYGISINVALAIFNMIPLPPLDGSHVLASILPAELSEKYRSIGMYGSFVLLILINLQPVRTGLSMVIRAALEPYFSIASFFA